MKVIAIIIGIVIFLVLLLRLGVLIQPTPFPAYPGRSAVLETVPLPEGLPAPVERFYHQTYGDEIPVIHSAVISGRATLNINGITLPSRFRFTHEAGKGYRHYFESTLFGLPLMKVNEHYLDGKGRLDLSILGVSEGPKIDQAANLGMWAEYGMFPSIWVTDPRVRWEPVDEETALLRIPYGEEEQTFVARFDSDSGMLRYLEVMRYRDADSVSKILWIAESVEYTTVDGDRLMTKGSATWLDQGKPWATFTAEDIVYNVDVSEYIRATGP
ncbi:MAG: hypothetical protein EHM70_25040 [Chloroflexota bacterium]|nr:MAG: hypothetical protein EHM70_25040 [Chloroflexota bacterium]